MVVSVIDVVGTCFLFLFLFMVFMLVMLLVFFWFCWLVECVSLQLIELASLNLLLGARSRVCACLLERNFLWRLWHFQFCQRRLESFGVRLNVGSG